MDCTHEHEEGDIAKQAVRWLVIASPLLCLMQVHAAPPVVMPKSPEPLAITTDLYLTVEQFVLVADMDVMPCTVNPESARRGPQQNPYVHVRLGCVDFLRGWRIDPSSITLNGQAVPLMRATGGNKLDADGMLPCDGKPLHLFFDSADVLDTLAPGEGERELVLQATITGGHLLVASDTVRVLEERRKGR